MTISFTLPDGVEHQLRDEFVDVGSALKEAAFVELYRQGKLSHGRFAECLGISRYEADAILKRHGVTEDLITLQEFNDQVAALQKALRE
jgi:predicted HTH domain antitoxin